MSSKGQLRVVHSTHPYTHAHAHPCIHAYVHGSLWSLHCSLGISTFNAASAAQPRWGATGFQANIITAYGAVTRLVRSPVVCGRRNRVWRSGLWTRQVHGRRGGRPRMKRGGVCREGGQRS